MDTNLLIASHRLNPDISLEVNNKYVEGNEEPQTRQKRKIRVREVSDFLIGVSENMKTLMRKNKGLFN